MKENPFEIKTPEQNSAQDVVDLFVDVFPDFYQVLEKDIHLLMVQEVQVKV